MRYLIVCLLVCSCGTEPTTLAPDMPMDSGPTQEAGSDSWWSDAHRFDTVGSPDGGDTEPDTRPLDSQVLDSLAQDSQLPDTVGISDTQTDLGVDSAPDQQVDSGLPDAAPLPDTTLPDTVAADSLLPDSTSPDTLSPDSSVPCIHPPVVKKCTYNDNDPWAFCTIPAGCFKMATSGNGICHATQFREVKITRSFVMMQGEITRDQYGSPPSLGYLPKHSITREQAAGHCNMESKKHGYPNCYETAWPHKPLPNFQACKGFRLPTEAEWEYAYRAGTSADFYNGGNLPLTTPCQTSTYADDIAWYKNTGSWNRKCKKTQNGWGLCDMGGNVWEIVQDNFQPSPGTTIIVDPMNGGLGPASPSVARGGSIQSWANGVTGHSRSISPTSAGSWHMGFRMVRTL